MNPADGIPRIELHCHLDASMRIDTITELAQEQGLSYERPISELARVPANCQSLIDFFVAIDIELDVLQHPAAIERAAAELVEDMHKDGIIHGEVRFAPHLHQRNGHSIDEIIDAAHRGLQRTASTSGMSAALIVCALRDRDPQEGVELVEAAGRLPGCVAAVDLAGPEAGHPAAPFEEMLGRAQAAGLGITIHAGEADGPASIREAVEMGATRIGHGVRSSHDLRLLSELARNSITLECCPTSNVITHAVPGMTEHPIDLLHQEGVPTTVSTDARTCLDITLDSELELLTTVHGWDRDRHVEAQRAAVRAAFVPGQRRTELLDAIG